MAWPALEVKQDDALGLAETRPATVASAAGGFRDAQQPREIQAEQSRAADAHEIAAGNAVASVFTRETGNDKHDLVLSITKARRKSKRRDEQGDRARQVL